MLRLFLVLSVSAIGLANNQNIEKVGLKLFYESLCRYCISFDPLFVDVVRKLSGHVNFNTYPYGNGHMTPNKDGSVTVTCQHEEPECYGNKLHACAFDVLGNSLSALEYNSCMMAHRSNDTAADKCGIDHNLSSANVKAIKKCAKGHRGHELLVYYGEESDLVDFDRVPYVLINGKAWNGERDDFLTDVCAAFSDPPEPCY